MSTKDFYREIAALYPPEVRNYYLADADRLAFHAGLVFSPGGSIVDIGSGLSPLALGLQKLGMQAFMFDRFDYPVDRRIMPNHQPVMELLKAHGVTLKTVDIECSALPLPNSAVEAVTCIAVLEHFHKSPKNLFAEMNRILKPGGALLVGCPNAVNLRKRVSVAFGRTNYPPIDQFWSDGDPRWYGHVREPTVDDLEWMTHSAGLDVIHVIGRNFIARQRFGAWGRLADFPLRVFPGLCSDIYVLARKRTS